MSPIVPEAYFGREQAFIKHLTLETYLQRLFMIIGRSEQVINYVDCFAGPWASEDDQELKDTSIGISIKQMKETADALHRQFNVNLKFRALYCEKDKIAFSKLQGFLSQDHGPVETTCLQGDYTDHIETIARWTCGHFTFFFIDPKGWKRVISAQTLAPLLRLPRSEFLINLMFEFANRALTIDQHRQDMRELFGDDHIFNGQESPESRREFILRGYRDTVNAVYRGRTAYVPVHRPGKDKLLYFLVYLTRHSIGVSVFKEQAEKMMGIQRVTQLESRLRNQSQKNGIIDMFADQATDLEPMDNRLSGRAFLLKHLSATPIAIDHEVWADWLELSDLYPSDLQLAMAELVKEGLAINIDKDATKRFKRPIHPQRANKAERWQAIKL
jgi:three-Cys-motif partner protein